MVCMILYVLKLIQFIVRDARKKRNTVVLPRENEKNPVSLLAASVLVSVSAQDGIVALVKDHTRSAPSLSSLPKVALDTVPIFAWLNTDCSRAWRAKCRPLPFSTPLSFRRSML